MKSVGVRLAILSPVVLLACGPSEGPQAPVQHTTSSAVASETAGPVTAPQPDLSVPPTTWTNPGGMWMPEQVASQGQILKTLGFTIDPAAFAKPTGFPLGAIVSLGGCTASFVSPDGLIITNHHCVVGALQYNSSDKEDFIKSGFLAKTRPEERSNGPASRVFVTQSFTDVTSKVREGLDKMKDDTARFKAIEDRQKSLVADCEKGKDGVKCSVASYFGGATYSLVEQLEIRDVRLVFAPPEGIGNYGKETDNWRWPRHAGDFGFFRAYVGKDGKPADYAQDNVPYKPANFLKIAADALKPGDPVMVTGYPAHTDRLTTAAEAHEAVTFDFPRIVDFTQVYLDALNKAKEGNHDRAIKAEPLIRGLANWQTNIKGQLEGLAKGGVELQKEEAEAELKKWIDADPSRKKSYGGVLEQMAKLEADHDKTREEDAGLREGLRMVKLLGAAHTIVRNAEERAKKDAERDPNYQDRNQRRLEASLTQLSKQYDAVLDDAMLDVAMKRSDDIESAFTKATAQPAKPQAGADMFARKAMLAQTKLGDEKTRLDLLKTATIADLKKSSDPMIQFALAIRPKTKAMEDRDKALGGGMANFRPRFVEALKEMRGGNLAPDANSTLRVTYGTVRGYAPHPGAQVYYPFTALSGVIAKNLGKDDFEAPPALLDAFKEKRFGKNVDPKLQEVPVDFLSDLDITGGNSGSPTLNGKGELVGLAFDGDYESMASNWVFIPDVTRSIHVDIRYVLWVADAVSHANNVLTELGITPSAQ